MFTPYTTRIRADQLLNDRQLTAVPSIYQKEIKKAYELRVLLIGNSVFAVKIDSQATKDSIDWRKDYGSLPPCQPFELSPHEEQKLRAFMRASQLHYGSVDLIVDEAGEYVFLEINTRPESVPYDVRISMRACWTTWMSASKDTWNPASRSSRRIDARKIPSLWQSPIRSPCRATNEVQDWHGG